MSTSATHAAPPRAALARLAAERAAWAGSAPQDARHAVLVLVKALDPADLVHGARSFAAALCPEEAEDWRHAWTRAVFRFGNPANLTARTPPRTVSPRGTAAWLGPYEAAHPPGVSRLLKPVSGQLPPLSGRLDVGGSGAPPRAGFTLRIATAGLSLAEYLVHLHHTVAEAVLRQLLPASAPLRLVHCPDLDPDEPDVFAQLSNAVYARTTPAEDGEPGALRLHTLLTPTEPGS